MSKLILFLFSSFLISALIKTAQSAIIFYSSYEYLSTVRLNNYNGYYGNVNMLRFSVPINTAIGSWFFQVRAAPSCPNTTIYIYLEYAGYPVVAPLNETFPSGFNLNRVTKTLALISVAGGGGSTFGLQSTQINVNSPKPGYWYSSVFYLNQGDKYSSSCYFYLASLTNIWFNNDTISLTANTPYAYTKTLNTYQYYKYFTTSNFNDPFQVSIAFNSVDTTCTLTALLRESALPITSSYSSNDNYIQCNQTSTQCSLNFSNPLTNTWYYLAVTSSCNYTLSLSVNSSSTSLTKTARFLSSTTFVSKYYLSTSSNNVFTFNTDLTPYFFEFLFDQATIGGTLTLTISNRILATTNISSQDVYLNACLMFNSISKYTSCTQGYKLTGASNTLAYTYLSVSVAYPMSGNWYLVLWRECYDKTTNLSVSCPNTYTQSVIIQMTNDQCANNYCGDYGTCNVVNSQANIFSTCKCTAGYQGYGCTDDSNAQPMSGYVGKVLFLTLSNLVFLFPVFLALHRRWYIESLMYFYSMFFSTFYHACDQQFFSFCIFNYNGLQLSDFIGAYSSFVITVLSMAAIPRLWKVFTFFLGIFLCISVNLNDRFSTAAFIALIVISSVFTIATWARIWWKKRTIYPKKKTLLFYVPGLAMAITGIVIYSSLGNDNNYWILHSIWHMLIAFSIVFFLPKCESGKPLFDVVKKYFIKKSSTVSTITEGATSENSTTSSRDSEGSSEPQLSSSSLSTQLSDSLGHSSIAKLDNREATTTTIVNNDSVAELNENHIVNRKHSKSPVQDY